jgi:hypothetical protein
MTDSPRRAENRRLYGSPRVPRPDRRLMVALLAAPGLSAGPLSELAQVGSGRACAVLGRLEMLGWVDRADAEGYDGRARFAWSLNPKGIACATLLLGLDARTAPGTGE